MDGGTVSALAVGAFALVVFVGVTWAMNRPSAATMQAVQQALAAGAVIVDVRTPLEFAHGHVRGARNLQVEDLVARMSELPTGGAVIVYCRTGARSARAADLLRAHGFNVLDAATMSAFPAELRAS